MDIWDEAVTNLGGNGSVPPDGDNSHGRLGGSKRTEEKNSASI